MFTTGWQVSITYHSPCNSVRKCRDTASGVGPAERSVKDISQGWVKKTVLSTGDAYASVVASFSSKQC